MIADEANVGGELEDFLNGGLFFGNLLTGNLAAAYDGDPGTTFVPGPASISDGIAPVVMSADGSLLPIRAIRAVGNRGGFNFLNQSAGKNVRRDEASAAADRVTVLGFEEAGASTSGYEKDNFDDAMIGVSASPISAEVLEALLAEIGISRIVGTESNDFLKGTHDDDQLIGLEGNDRLKGHHGDDNIQASDGDDKTWGGRGSDEISGEDGNDRLSGNRGNDEIDGGECRDWLFGGRGADERQRRRGR